MWDNKRGQLSAAGVVFLLLEMAVILLAVVPMYNAIYGQSNADLDVYSKILAGLFMVIVIGAMAAKTLYHGNPGATMGGG